MSHSKGKPSNTVFVRNIPFEFTEEQLIDVFKEVGPVISFKLVFDKETGRPKGFGFCQYYDIDTASSAVRNLNGYELGGRTIHVVFADPHASGGGGGHADSGSRNAGDGDRYRDAHASGSFLGSANANHVVAYRTIAQTNPKITAVDAISQTLASMSQEQLQELIAHVQVHLLTR
ncbi:hypothetical protein H4R34_004656 [Dimargaris verticillata]|uniref:RRM domain-containing protein n=1 Tax=Dimargaris verticillata TaxID=2761393 RepID=A0A9W8B3R8_9FUNG|nr:hypothetical protein H4R34_004656 [Dimargaris verticillata]